METRTSHQQGTQTLHQGVIRISGKGLRWAVSIPEVETYYRGEEPKRKTCSLLTNHGLFDSFTEIFFKNKWGNLDSEVCFSTTPRKVSKGFFYPSI